METRRRNKNGISKKSVSAQMVSQIQFCLSAQALEAIDGHLARGTAAHPEARDFGPAQARHGRHSPCPGWHDPYFVF
jgi:hypothetical protein